MSSNSAQPEPQPIASAAPSAVPLPAHEPPDTGESDRPGRVLFALHGICTHAGWNRALYEVAHLRGWQVRTDRPNYGYFSVMRFLLPWARSAKVGWFRKAYREETHDRDVALDAGQCPCVVAHSFGTYILGNAMLKYDWLRFDKIILCGSILPRDFPWDKLIERGQVQAVRNEYGVKDIWSGLVRWFVAGTGPSGRIGFCCRHERFEQERFDYTHSECFDKGHMEAKWMPFLDKKSSAIPRQDVSVQMPKLSRPWALYACYVLLAFVLLSTTRAGTNFCHRRQIMRQITYARDLNGKAVDQGKDGKALYSDALAVLDRVASQEAGWERLVGRMQQTREQIFDALAEGDAKSARQRLREVAASSRGLFADAIELEGFLNVRFGVMRNWAYLQSRDLQATGYKSLLLAAGLGYVQLAFSASESETRAGCLVSAAECLRDLGNQEFKRGEDHLARRSLRAAMSVYDLATTEAGGRMDMETADTWAALLISNGRVLKEFRCLPDAVGAYEAARKLLEPIRDSGGMMIKRHHAVAQLNQGFCEYEQGMNRAARTNLSNARTALLTLIQSAEEEGKDSELRGQWALCSVFLGSALRELGEKDKTGKFEAVRECDEARRALDGWYDPALTDPVPDAEAYGAALNALGWAYLSAGDLDRAETVLNEASDQLAQLAREHPDRHYARGTLAWAYRHLACVHLDAGRKEQAAEYFRKATGEWTRLRLDDQDRAEAAGDGSGTESRFTYDFIGLLVHCELPELRQPPWALTLTRRFGDLQQRRGRSGDMLAAALYRNEQYEECVRALEEEKSKNGFDLLLLSMARWRSGQKDLAKNAYEEAERERVANWSGSREFRKLRDEARTVLDLPDMDQPAPAPNGTEP